MREELRFKESALFRQVIFESGGCFYFHRSFQDKCIGCSHRFDRCAVKELCPVLVFGVRLGGRGVDVVHELPHR